MPAIKYFFSSPGSDAIEAGPRDLTRPLKISLSETHSTLTLGDYFHAVTSFLLEEHADKLLRILADIHGTSSISLSSIDKIHLYSEKLGAFYHIASIHIHYAVSITKFAVSTAFTPSGERCLAHDFKTLSRLRTYTGCNCMTRPFFMGRARPKNSKADNSFLMVLAEWLEGFHEWHFSHDIKTDEKHIVLWDYTHGARFLQNRSEKKIFRQIANILTVCFNPDNGDQICRWHNAAGDFIIKEEDGTIGTRLTTVRAYHPLMEYENDTADNSTLCLIFFFLDLSVRISMDRLDGVGKPVWAGESFLRPTLQGFLEGLRTMEDKKRLESGAASGILQLLKQMDRQEFKALYRPLLNIYDEEHNMDYTLITSNINGHINGLINTLKKA